MIECPNCKSTKVMAFDNNPLSFDQNWLKDVGQQMDEEIDVHFKCHTCTHTFSKTFKLTIPQ